ncbi:ABC transporter ATP-binding protein [Paenibacillus oceani]|uniref:ABC transporter ATP-binding protein n=1 Tax=Paenibacillus oceani TaxID=2772510 RepID=A0A927C5X3_9BACL|nr:ABC transporter ATP-binding protein [Paenibacillus oceani]MBD2861959.1 ABC transporter ATP-binding protein [Paenibacillus oceani]
MKRSSRYSLGRCMMLLVYRIWRAMPVLASVWLAVPLLLGLLLVPGFAAQRELIDLFTGGIGGKSWTEMLALAWQPVVVIAAVAMLRSSLSALDQMTDSGLKDRASMLLQAEVHAKAVGVPLERMEQAGYYDRLDRANQAARSELFDILQNGIALLRLLFEFAGLLVVCWLADPVVGVILAFVFTVSFAIRLEADMVKRRLNRELTFSGRYSDYLRSAAVQPATVKELRLFGSMSYLIGKWHAVTEQAVTLRGDANRREIRHGIVVSAVQIAGLFASIVWLVLQMKAGTFTAGTLVVVFQAMRQAYGISGRMAWPVGKLYLQSAKITDLVRYLHEPPETEAGAGERTGAAERRERYGPDGASAAESRSSQVPGEEGCIVFDQVEFRYPGASQPVLRNIRLELKPGETVALVGGNGAGKSTLVRLLLGLYEPTSGQVTWDGTDYRELDRELFRESVSAAFQDYVRYETTVRDNVGFGRPDLLNDDDSVRLAMRAGGAERIGGGDLDSRVGLVTEGARELSGGQWQRLAISRAAIRPARLLVLDEPTAALDPQHEQELYRSFRELSRGRTVLFVSHRLGWARYADRIVVLRDGAIAEEGTHEALMAADSCYAAMFRAQAWWYCDERGGKGQP